MCFLLLITVPIGCNWDDSAPSWTWDEEIHLTGKAALLTSLGSKHPARIGETCPVDWLPYVTMVTFSTKRWWIYQALMRWYEWILMDQVTWWLMVCGFEGSGSNKSGDEAKNRVDVMWWGIGESMVGGHCFETLNSGKTCLGRCSPSGNQPWQLDIPKLNGGSWGSESMCPCPWFEI
jgi:hypothetical protein